MKPCKPTTRYITMRWLLIRCWFTTTYCKALLGLVSGMLELGLFWKDLTGLTPTLYGSMLLEILHHGQRVRIAMIDELNQYLRGKAGLD